MFQAHLVFYHGFSLRLIFLYFYVNITEVFIPILRIHGQEKRKKKQFASASSQCWSVLRSLPAAAHVLYQHFIATFLSIYC